MQLDDTELSLYYKEIFPMMFERLTYTRKCDEKWRENIPRNIDILIGHTVHGISKAELAREYGISSTTVANVINKALGRCGAVMSWAESASKYQGLDR